MEQTAAAQRMKELRLRYGWTQLEIYTDHEQIALLEAGRRALDTRELINAYVKAFRIDKQTLGDYQNGLITCDEFIVRAGVKPDEEDPEGIDSERLEATLATERLAPWEHSEVEELLVLTLVARGMPKLVANVVVRSERLKLREYPSWPLRIAHMESVREAKDEDARLTLPAAAPQTSRASTAAGQRSKAASTASRAPSKPSAARGTKGAAAAKKRS